MSSYQSFNSEFDPWHKEFDDYCQKNRQDHSTWAEFIIKNLYRLSDDSIKHMYLTKSSWSENVYKAVIKEYNDRAFEKEFLKE